ncbi:right-handed parallel beta-helix repeat-containing protein [Flavilitoribacter nigricans]|uniref:Right handed beta helix domain-containing protein n=1 Tax=Flavilitoribacter nigricans (strain ATCC 23147 / DSM 23189 / NBRC 102662 / NCIMB 1420 / SS-2) TaxID=1122177 RepID=A0A2D0N7R0_FLAN2|nr:right-handed parallel beta-helix repeat-containing protein [Flavilitoribacter nigricans]PHN04551.1 hypothetical protein CRP01_21340 [Flavilitoribacter nigricans DSM 23189 = NBRC 102662]
MNNKLFFFAVAILLSCTSSWATNYYVHPELGREDNTGTNLLYPFQSLAQLQDLDLSPGDSILLAAGYTFPGTIVLQSVKGTENAPIVISSYTVGNALEDPRARIDARGQANGILLIDAGHIVVRDLIIEADGGGPLADSDMRCGVLVRPQTPGDYRNISLHHLDIRNVFYEDPGISRGKDEVRTANGSQSYGWGIRFINRTEGAELSEIRVTDCMVEHVAHTGIKFTGRDKSIRRIRLYNNRVLRTGGPGIQMSGVVDGHIKNNYVSHSGSPDDSRKWGRGSGLWTWGSSEIIIERNHFLNANGPGDSAGCHIDFNCNNVIVQYNFSANNAGGFCEILGNNYNCAYRYNISVNDGHRVKGKEGAFQEGKIFWLSGYQGNKNPRKGPFNSYFYNNTIYVNQDIVAKIAVDKAASGILIANNIFYIAGASQAVLGDQYRPEKEGASSITHVNFTNNLYLSPGNWPEKVLIQDTAPKIGNPGFHHAGGLNITDYIPANTAIIDRQGIPIQPLTNDTIGLYIGLQPETDILGNPNGDRPDLGAIAVH